MDLLDILILIGYFVGMFIIGIVVSKKQSDVKDYFVGARKNGTFSIMSLWFSSWIGGAAVVGTAEVAYNFGVSGSWYVLGSVIGCIIFASTTSGKITELGKKLNFITYAELIEHYYGKKTTIVAVITTLLGNIGFTAGQFAAAGGVFHILLGMDMQISYMISAIVVILYTSMGGLKAVTYTDWVQFLLIMIGISIAGIPFSNSAIGGAETLKQLPIEFFDLGNWGWGTILGLIVTTILSFYTSMDSFTKCFSAKDQKASRNGTVLAGITMTTVAISSTYIGLAGRILFPYLENSSQIAYKVILEYFPPFIKGLALVGVLAAIMSSADILLLQASANVSRDIYFRLVPSVDDKKILKISMLSSLGIGILAMLISMTQMNIINILYIALTVNSAGLFLPTVAAILYDCRDGVAAFWSMLLTLITVLLWYALGPITSYKLFQIDPIWPGLIVSSVTFLTIIYYNKSKLKLIKN